MQFIPLPQFTGDIFWIIIISLTVCFVLFVVIILGLWRSGVRVKMTVVYENTLRVFGAQEAGNLIHWMEGNFLQTAIRMHPPIIEKRGFMTYRCFFTHAGSDTTTLSEGIWRRVLESGELADLETVSISDIRDKMDNDKEIYRRQIYSSGSVRDIVSGMTMSWKKGLVWLGLGLFLGVALTLMWVVNYLIGQPATSAEGFNALTVWVDTDVSVWWNNLFWALIFVMLVYGEAYLVYLVVREVMQDVKDDVKE